MVSKRRSLIEGATSDGPETASRCGEARTSADALDTMSTASRAESVQAEASLAATEASERTTCVRLVSA